MKCPKCGYDNQDGADHCDLCKEILAKPQEFSRPRNEPYQPARSMEAPSRSERPIISSPADGKIDSREAIKFGWEAMKEHFWLFMGIGITFVGICGIEGLVQMLVIGGSRQFSFTGFILQILFAFLNMVIFNLGYNKVCLKIVDDETPEYGDLFSCFHLGIPYIMASIIIGLILLPAAMITVTLFVLLKNSVFIGIIGLLILIITISVLLMRFVFIALLMIDKKLGPIECVKANWHITRGKIWDLSTFFLLLSLIFLAGVLCLGVGLIAALPTGTVAAAYYYRQLSRRI